MLSYEKPTANDGEQLTQIAYSSKRYWNYSDAQMLLWKDDLTIDSNYILDNLVYKVINQKTCIGFYVLKFDDNETCYEIDHLWLMPENINKGFGAIIFKNIIAQLSELKQKRCTLIAEPNAIGFYKKMNGKIIRSFESKIPGRMLDVYEFKTNQE